MYTFTKDAASVLLHSRN